MPHVGSKSEERTLLITIAIIRSLTHGMRLYRSCHRVRFTKKNREYCVFRWYFLQSQVIPDPCGSVFMWMNDSRLSSWTSFFVRWLQCNFEVIHVKAFFTDPYWNFLVNKEGGILSFQFRLKLIPDPGGAVLKLRNESVSWSSMSLSCKVVTPKSTSKSLYQTTCNESAGHVGNESKLTLS